MMWRWLVNGLSGLVGMISSHQESASEVITPEIADKLERHIHQLQTVLDAARRSSNG